jgi:MinD superfamily P-loop ATPase
MRIAIASGKGGTGKTTIAVALAQTSSGPVMLLDCDVEEPNDHIFLKSEQHRKEPVTVKIPQVIEDKCNGCGACKEMCQFNAIIIINTKPLVFPEMCHSCGGCMKVCPTGAIEEVDKEIGSILFSEIEHIQLITGVLDVGHALAPPMIRAVKKHIQPQLPVIIDSPPGNACPMVTAVGQADYTILVTEPTPFGLHDLTLAIATLEEIKMPFGVVINRSDAGDFRVQKYCAKNRIPLLAEIPESRLIAETYSNGESIVEKVPQFKSMIMDLWKKIEETISSSNAVVSKFESSSTEKGEFAKNTIPKE